MIRSHQECKGRRSLLAQWVENPLLSLLWHRFNPWPRNFCMPWARPKKKRQLLGHEVQQMDRREWKQPWPKQLSLQTLLLRVPCRENSTVPRLWFCRNRGCGSPLGEHYGSMWIGGQRPPW